MKWLFIDTHLSRRVRVGTVNADGIVRAKVQDIHASKALSHVAAVLKKERTVQGVCVVNGPGTFSAVRVGVVIANIIASVRHVPLVGVDSERAEHPQELAVQLAHAPMHTSYVAPLYDAEPTITLPKTRV